MAHELPAPINELTRQVIGSAMTVHRELGPGLTEDCCENALCLELAASQIGFAQQERYPVSYRDRVVGTLIPDLIVSDTVIVENKVVDQIVGAHVAQVLTYFSVTGLHVGLILNYKYHSLQFKRVVQTGNTPPSAVENLRPSA